MNDLHRRAERATRFARAVEFVAACVLIFCAFYGFGYIAMIGDEIQQARQQQAACEAFGTCSDD